MSKKKTFGFSWDKVHFMGLFDSKESAKKEARATAVDEKIFYVGEYQKINVSSYFSIDALIDSIEYELGNVFDLGPDDQILEYNDVDKLFVEKGVSKLLNDTFRVCTDKVINIEEFEVIANG